MKQQDISKLKQLDRIEYMLKENKIQERYSWNLSINTLWYLLITIISMATFMLVAKVPTEQILTWSLAVLIFMRIVILIYVILFIYEMIKMVLKSHYKNKLNSEYFKTEVRK